jgi:asparagine synthase (glutamine-hydrolysing)
MDPRGGDQPISNEDGAMSIIANGEIYNFPELSESLQIKHDLKTSSDTEAVLHLYEDAGEKLVHKLQGMYAFAIADGENYTAPSTIDDPLILDEIAELFATNKIGKQ